jgi:hypothetical protein
MKMILLLLAFVFICGMLSQGMAIEAESQVQRQSLDFPQWVRFGDDSPNNCNRDYHLIDADELAQLSNELTQPGQLDKQQPVLIGAPCFGPDSLGNSLSMYMEGRLCGQELGVTYIAAPKMEHNQYANHTFFKALPAFALNRTGSYGGSRELEAAMRKRCCISICHERHDSLIHKHMPIAGAIFRQAIDTYWAERTANGVKELPFTTLPQDSGSKIGFRGNKIDIRPDTNLTEIGSLPVIPDVAVHYRCGDNVYRNYGFMPFGAMKSVINSSDATIYVMAEHPGRKADHQRRQRCHVILDGLLDYLMQHYPTATVVLLRGDDMFEDLVRLTLAKKTICSASTFCLWPAAAQTNDVYYPATGLVGYENHLNYGSHFHWLDDTKFGLFQGNRAMYTSDQEILHYLQHE